MDILCHCHLNMEVRNEHLGVLQHNLKVGLVFPDERGWFRK